MLTKPVVGKQALVLIEWFASLIGGEESAQERRCDLVPIPDNEDRQRLIERVEGRGSDDRDGAHQKRLQEAEAA